MALTTCRECSKDVSTTASKCPHCGVSAPSREAQKAQIVAVLVTLAVLLIPIGYCSLQNNSAGAESEAAKAEKATKNAFQDVCESKVKLKLAQPATFEISWTTSPVLHEGRYIWGFNFDASNAYGAKGHYKATCWQLADGTVRASISDL